MTSMARRGATLAAAALLLVLAVVPAANAAPATSPLDVSLRQVRFGRVVVGEQAIKPLLVTNTGTDPALITYTFTNDVNFGITTSECGNPGDGYVLAGGVTCTINLVFIASSAGRYKGTMNIFWSVNGSSAELIAVPERATAINP